jgi:hypothetical protein
MLIRTENSRRGLSRRAMLRGLGTLVALPVLEAMAPSVARAQGQAPVRRFLSFYVPNGIHMAAFTPSSMGPLQSAALPRILQPLAPHLDHVTVVSGLENRAGFADADGPGDHARGTGTFLTCTRLLKSDTTIRNAVSIDQVLAGHLRSQGYAGLASLETGIEGGGSTGNCDSGYSCAYTVNIAWAGASQPLPKETNPRAVFDRLFAGLDPAQASAEAAKRRRRKLSVLDTVRADAARLEQQLGARDRQKLDEYMTGVRELERRTESESVVACTTPSRPSGASQDPTAHVRTMLDVIAAGYACDRVRVATFMLGNGGSNRNYSFIGHNTAHHEASHHQGDPTRHTQLTEIGRWEVEQLAYLTGRLAAIDEGNGRTGLDDTTVFFSSEIEDGNSHAHSDLPVVVVGHGGGAIPGGRHVRHPRGTPMANLFSTVLGTFGAPTSFADSTGTLALG